MGRLRLYGKPGRVVGAQREGWKKILEDRDVPRPGRHLTRVRWVRRRRERVVLGRGKKGAVLPIAGIRDPFGPDRMPSEMRVGEVRNEARAWRDHVLR